MAGSDETFEELSGAEKVSKVCLITGATAGIGQAAAIELAAPKYDFKLVIVARNKDRCENTVALIKQKHKDAKVDYLVADLSSYKQVRQLASEFKSKYDQLDVLVNNAGAIFFSHRESADGLEMTWALNHFGYFWLSLALSDLLKKSAPSRVINVSSAAHRRAFLPSIDTIGKEKNQTGYPTYGNTKLANIWFTRELHKRIFANGVTVNSMHPGIVATNFASDNGLFGNLFRAAASLFWVPVEKGATTIVYLATSPSVVAVSGEYFENEKISKPSKLALDDAMAEALWRKSEEITASLK
ncbi:MAG: SDR family oxidoreductase [Candidatus Melainabacteria bacterium]|nr:SDR family oxidoreductase [Candidatus Melainabacteria bacterium]